MNHRLHRPAAMFIAVYAIAILCLLGQTQLWLDELIQLGGTRTGDLSRMRQLVAEAAGGVPLGWIIQIAAIRAFGYSPEVARLPSALASIASCICLVVLCGQLGVRRRWLPLAIFALLPLQFRYALEGRPYAIALCFSSLATVFFLRFVERRRLADIALYTIFLAAGVYTQAFSLFVAVAHVLWLLTASVPAKAAALRWTIAAAAAAALAFSPWYLYAAPIWKQITIEDEFRFHADWKTPLMLIREISGAGYWGSVLLLLLGGLGALRGRWENSSRRLLILLVGAPAACVFLVDSTFGYFVAIRQMIYVLPALAILAAEGLAVFCERSRRDSAVVGTVFIAVLLWYDYRWLSDPRENWQAAAEALVQRAGHNSCVLFVPQSAKPYYTFFQPDLNRLQCREAGGAPSVIVAVSPYVKPHELAKGPVQGHTRQDQVTVGGTRIERYVSAE